MMDRPLNGPVVALATGTTGPNDPLSPENIADIMGDYDIGPKITVWRIPPGQINLPKLAGHRAPWDFIVIEGEHGSVVLVNWHGPGHLWSPTGVPWKQLVASLIFFGVTHLINSSAVGTYVGDKLYNEGMYVGDLAILEQLHCNEQDFAFFEKPPLHLPFAQPFCSMLNNMVATVASENQDLGMVHRGAWYYTIKGPRFATAAESMTRKNMGFHLSGMTYGRVAVLLREAGIHTTTICKIVDQDAWHVLMAQRSGQEVSVEQVEHALGEAGPKCARLQVRTAGYLLAQLSHGRGEPSRRELACSNCTPGLRKNFHGDLNNLNSDQRQLLDFLERR